jgi:hypothetical protein
MHVGIFVEHDPVEVQSSESIGIIGPK